MNLNNFYYRVDNLRPNSLVVKGVVKKAGSGLATPMMTAEQKEWWKKTVGKKTISSSANGTPLSPEDKLRRKEIMRQAKEMLRGKEMHHANFSKPITISGGKISEWLNQPFNEYKKKNQYLVNFGFIISFLIC